MSIEKIVISIVILGTLCFHKVSAQTLKGKLLDYTDHSVVKFANVVVFDSANNIITGVSTDSNGDFVIDIPLGVNYLTMDRFPEFSELQILKVVNSNQDSIDLGELYLVRMPSLIEVQFKDVSLRKERKYQRHLSKDYNKKIKEYSMIEIQTIKGNYAMTPFYEKDSKTNRLKLIYAINFDDLNE